MKLIFLDIDGVLNSGAFYRERPPEARLALSDETWWQEMIDAEAVARLNRIIAETGANVVISSSWRIVLDAGALRSVLKACGFEGEIIGVTDQLVEGTRGDEIVAWLAHTAHDVEAFAILDDDEDMGELVGRLIRTTWELGLQDEHVERALELLA
jgi:hypothetical protein